MRLSDLTASYGDMLVGNVFDVMQIRDFLILRRILRAGKIGTWNTSMWPIRRDYQQATQRMLGMSMKKKRFLSWYVGATFTRGKPMGRWRRYGRYPMVTVVLIYSFEVKC